MREIKFRYVWKSGEPNLITTEIFNIQQIEDGEVEDFVFSEESELGEKLELVERNDYTGLKDKNGKEIYEGDILRFLNPLQSKAEYAKHPYHYLLVTWNEQRFGWNIATNDDIEIIGNCYENPGILFKENNAGD